MSTHIVIPDTQVKPGIGVDHLRWAGRYIAEKFAGKPDVNVIHLGDHWDLPSLSFYDRGKKSMEGRRVQDDIDAGLYGFDLLDEPITAAAGTGRKKWKPRKVYLRGNHEERLARAIENDAQLDGVLSLDMLAPPAGWETHEFLHVVNIDGVAYSHYFCNPMSGKPWGGLIDNRIQKVGTSFTMGHQQQLLYGVRYALNRSLHGLVCGAFYQHMEDYKGPQGNDHWRGIVVCHQVENGSYDLMTVSLDFLCRKYEGRPLAAFTPKLVA